MEKTRSSRPKLGQLTGIRIIAALWVVLYHAQHQLVGLLPEAGGLWFVADAGYMAVDLFFILSGFIISYMYLDKFIEGRVSYREFIWKRLARIYPVQIATLLAYIAIFLGAKVIGASIGNPENFTVWGAVKDVLLIRVWVGDDFGWNYPAWSLSAEWLAYLLFPLIVVAVSALARKGLSAMIGAGVVLLGVAALLAALFPSINAMPWPAVRVLIGFTLGCIIFSMSRSVAFTPTQGWCGAVSLLALMLVTPAVPQGSARAFVGLLFAAATIYFLARGSGPAVNALGSRVLEYGGRISFSVYMIHSLVLLMLARLVPLDQWTDANLPIRVSIVIAHLLLPLIAGAATYHVIEKPAHAWMVGRIRKPSPPSHSSPRKGSVDQGLAEANQPSHSPAIAQ